MYMEIEALVRLYATYFPPLRQSHRTVSSILSDLITMYSVSTVELAMLEAIYQDRATLHYVMRLLLTWKKQGRIVVNYTEAFYREMTRKERVPPEVRQVLEPVDQQGSSLPLKFSPEEIEEELRQIEGILRVLPPEKKALLYTEATQRVPRYAPMNEETYDLLVRAALWEIVREQYLG
ncbi:MAG: hypothetical protein D6736_10905 [Nitrospinota bacterium]|nr:MAG: hypothetical protein D6736_10905 [Nitrospinota bacterium]